jgi:hypothetical protein
LRAHGGATTVAPSSFPLWAISSRPPTRRCYARALAAKYPSFLGNRRVTINRVDLGERGVFYRAQIGPLPSADEAGAMCSILKEAGGQCVVQRN